MTTGFGYGETTERTACTADNSRVHTVSVCLVGLLFQWFDGSQTFVCSCCVHIYDIPNKHGSNVHVYNNRSRRLRLKSARFPWTSQLCLPPPPKKKKPTQLWLSTHVHTGAWWVTTPCKRALIPAGWPNCMRAWKQELYAFGCGKQAPTIVDFNCVGVCFFRDAHGDWNKPAKQN